MSTTPDTLEREDLEIVVMPEPDLDEGDLHHIGCCMWPFYVLTNQPHYALCGVLLEGPPALGDGPPCEVCARIDAEPSTKVCPQYTFGGGLT